MPDRGVVVGFDFGARRIGVALGNPVTCQARPLQTLETGTRQWEHIADLLRDWQPARLVVGVPRHPDGTPHEMTARSERFARQLAGRFGLPVDRVDERYSSVEARSRRGDARGAAGARRTARAGGAVAADRRADPIDAEAAAVILQQWFDEHGPHRADAAAGSAGEPGRMPPSSPSASAESS